MSKKTAESTPPPPAPTPAAAEANKDNSRRRKGGKDKEISDSLANLPKPPASASIANVTITTTVSDKPKEKDNKPKDYKGRDDKLKESKTQTKTPQTENSSKIVAAEKNSKVENINSNKNVKANPAESNPAKNSVVTAASFSSSSSKPSDEDLLCKVIKVPEALVAIVSDATFTATLLKVKQQTGVNYLKISRDLAGNAEAIEVSGQTPDAVTLAINLLNTRFKLELRLLPQQKRVDKLKNDFYTAQGDLASGMTVEFSINPELIGMIVGRQGARIKEITAETGVTSINIDKDSGKGRILGNDSKSVMKARELLEVRKDEYELDKSCIDWLSNKFNSSALVDIRTTSKLLHVEVDPKSNRLIMTGTIPSLAQAEIMLTTQLEYISRQIELEGEERAAADRLYEMKKQYGGRYYDGERGGRGGRGGGRGDDRGQRGGRGDRSYEREERGGRGERSYEREERGGRGERSYEREERGGRGGRSEERRDKGGRGDRGDRGVRSDRSDTNNRRALETDSLVKITEKSSSSVSNSAPMTLREKMDKGKSNKSDNLDAVTSKLSKTSIK